MSDGRGVVRLRPHAKVVVLPTCLRCRQVAPRCLCGYPANRKPPHQEGQ